MMVIDSDGKTERSELSYLPRQAAHLLDRPQLGLRLVTCYLGAVASLAAVRVPCGVLTGSNADIFLERESTPNRSRGQTHDRQW